MSAEREGLLERLHAGGVDPALAGRLTDFGEMLLQANRKTNLTAARTPQALGEHLLDSLTVVPYLDEPFVDVGSGGGLPAIPASLASGIGVTLVESNAKKAGFLSEALAALGIGGTVRNGRVEAVAQEPGSREAFACATARAVSTLPTVLELTLPLLRVGGLAVLQRGALEQPERSAAADAAAVLGGRIEAEVPLDGNRRIVLVRKTGATPLRFPRRAGVPEKRPLCS
jgi:16S rRNA (guanine527-N7)-methyltransferase